MENRIAVNDKTDHTSTHLQGLFDDGPVVKTSREVDGLFIRQISSKGIRAGFYENRSPYPKTHMLSTEADSVVLHFQLSGTCRVQTSLGETRFKSNEQNICIPSVKRYGLHTEGDSEFCILLLDHSHVERLMDEAVKAGTFDQNINKGFKWLSKHHLPITLPMADSIESMFRSDRTGIFCMLHTESLMVQLLLLQLEQMASHDCRVFCSLKQSEIDKIYHARKVIMQNLGNWFTISEIAYKVGTNECTLKKGFKEVFGTPVFEFTQQYKMQEAYRLLSEADHSIACVSEKLGYKNSTHFSAAFKRKFGFSPGNVRFLRKKAGI